MDSWDNEYPESTEYAHFYSTYVELVDKTNIINTLNNQMHEVFTLMNSIPGDKAYFKYAPDKWTIPEIWTHLMDAERIFAYRALRIARGDNNPLLGYDHNAYVPMSGAGQRSRASIISEYKALRESTLQLFQNFSEEAWTRRGEASGYTVSTRALAYIIAGHEKHHVAILKERYL